jgi:dTDP-4-amino-4,6-dideoxygalactose transaminase
MNIPFSPPRIDELTIKEVTDTLLSGWVTTGPKTKLFEDKLAEFIGIENVVCLNSATAGLQLAMHWLGIKEGDEIILPAYTYCATANVVAQKGAKPVMVDVNENDFNINHHKIKELINENTKAIIAVDIAGLPADYREIREIINQSEILKKFKPGNDIQKKLGRIALISDSAHSIGASYHGKKTGNQADMSSFSFHAVKNLTTAEGGAVAFNLPENFNNKEVKQLFKVLSLHGQNKDALTKNKAGGWEYDVTHAGYKCNMTDIQAAIGLVELKRYAETLLKRKEIFQIYDDSFANKNWAITPSYKSNNKLTSYHLYMLRIKGCNLEQRNEIIEKMALNGIAVNVHYKPLPLLTFYKNLNYNIDDFPQSYNNFKHEISLPVFYNLTKEQALYVTKTLISITDQVLK